MTIRYKVYLQTRGILPELQMLGVLSGENLWRGGHPIRVKFL
jgi:hypothetical protein